VKVELGCGNHPLPGYVHHDRWKHSPFVDVVWDLEKLPWPWASDSVDEVLALDVMEHLRLEVQEWLDEAWRILKVGGILEFRLPAWDNPYSYRDPTHRRIFHQESFLYWCPDAPGTVWKDFGRYYFGEGYNRWWQQLNVGRDNKNNSKDFRWMLRKIIKV